MPRRTMTIEEARAWLEANKHRFDKYDGVEDMPPEIRETRLLGPDSELAWKRLLRELNTGDGEDEDDAENDSGKR